MCVCVCVCVSLGKFKSSLQICLEQLSSFSYGLQKKAEQEVDTAKEKIPYFIFDEQESSGRC